MAENWKIEKTTGKGEDAKTVATYTVTGLSLIKAGEGWKVDPQNEANIATFVACVKDFPGFAGALLNTHVPVFLRNKLPDGFRGTLRQAVETASAGAGAGALHSLKKQIAALNKELTTAAKGGEMKKVAEIAAKIAELSE